MRRKYENYCSGDGLYRMKDKLGKTCKIKFLSLLWKASEPYLDSELPYFKLS